MVEQVEDLPAELDLLLFVDREVLEEGKIPGVVPGPFRTLRPEVP
jgi:hypothetical protein